MWLRKKEEKEKKTEVVVGGSGCHFVPGCPAALHITWPNACMTVLGGVSDISTATYGCHSNLGTNLDGVGWGGGVVGCCRMESRKLICTCGESESGFNCWRVKLKWIESCSKHEKYQGKGGQKNGLGRLILVNHLHYGQGYIQIISSRARK